jgi:Tol biopolymer transport system component
MWTCIGVMRMPRLGRLGNPRARRMGISRCVRLTLGVLIGVAGGCSEPTAPIPLEGVPPPGGPPPGGPPPAPTGEYSIHLADSSGVDLRQLAYGFAPAWSPDGSRIAFQGISVDGTSSGIFVMDVDGTARRLLTGGDSWSPRWSPDGSRIAFLTCIPNEDNGSSPMCDMTYSVMNADGSGEVTLARTNFAGTIPPAEWSPDGKKIAFVGGEGCCADLYVINTDGSGLAQLTRLGTVTGADWSPDGRMLALRAAGSVYVINADGSDLTELTNDVGSLVVRHAEWSPLGDRIAFSLSLDPLVWETVHGGSLTIHVINADGTDRITVATNARDPRWLRDGRSLSFGRWFDDEIWIVSADGGVPSLLLGNGVGAEWSPDGSRIAYVKHRRPTVINGVYDLTASVTDFDPAWGYDMSDYQYTAILRFEHDARFIPGIAGTFSDLRLTGLDVEPRAPMSGVITSTAHGGRIVIELEVIGDFTSFHLTLVPSGDLLGPVIQGRFGCCGHIGGPFTANRVSTESIISSRLHSQAVPAARRAAPE